MSRIVFTSKVNAELERAIPPIAYDQITIEQHGNYNLLLSFVRKGEVVGTLIADMPNFASGATLTIDGLEGAIRPVVEFIK